MSNLSDVPALPRTHYIANTANAIFSNEELLYDQARITGTISLNNEWPNSTKIAMAKRVAERTSVDYAFSSSPFTGGRVWPSFAVPTYSGAEWQGELDFMEAGITTLLANGITPTTFIISSEAFPYDTEVIDSVTHYGGIGSKKSTWPDYVAWNAALVEKWDSIYDLYKSLVPTASICYYNCGGQEWWHAGFYQRTNFDLSCKKDMYACSCYEATQTLQLVEEYRQTAIAANSDSSKKAVPWISLAKTGQREGGAYVEWSSWGDKEYGFENDWWNGLIVNQDSWDEPIVSTEIGRAPWSEAPYIILYTIPYSGKYWKQHFSAYCHGANNIAQTFSARSNFKYVGKV